MDHQQFLDAAFKNLPGGLILVDLKGRVRAMNETAELLLGLTGKVNPGDHCREVLDAHPKIIKVLLDTCTCQTGASRQEIVTQRPDGEKMVIGYSTVIMKNSAGDPFGAAMTFQDITRYIPLPLKAEYIRIVDRFFTPFALSLVISSLFLGFAEPKAKWTAIGLVVFLSLFNEISAYLAKKKIDWAVPVGNTRIVTNFVANVLLVYLLGTFWGPMWLLFVLTPVATALYASWTRTLATAAIS